MRFGILNDRSLDMLDSLTCVARELAMNTLDSVRVYDVRWDKGSTVRAGDYMFCVPQNSIKFSIIFPKYHIKI